MEMDMIAREGGGLEAFNVIFLANISHLNTKES